jgi:hypothetical protein
MRKRGIIFSEAHNAPERVPLRARDSFEPNSLIQAQAVITVSGLDHLYPRNSAAARRA